jgi:O-succinylbenzoate synthase
VIELHRIAMPLVTPFRTAHGTTTTKEALLVHVTTADAEGWGECSAGPLPDYTEEYLDGAAHVLEQLLVPGLLAGVDTSWVRGHHMAKAALELAVLDASLRGAGESLQQHLGGVRDAVDAGVAVGITDDVAALLDAVSGYVDEGYRRVKLKVQPGWDVAPVAAVRDRFGDGLALQVDANSSYTMDDAGHLAELDAFELLLIEQPLAADDLLGHAALARRLRTPICLDESITSAATAATALALGACSIVNIKPGRVGGYREAVRVHDLCVEASVAVWCGGMLETGIGRAANLALASLPGFTLPGDLSASSRYFTADVISPGFTLDEDGRIAVPIGPGIGVAPDPDVLAEMTVTRRVLT